MTGSAPEARRRLAAARVWATHRFPYLAQALFAAPVVDAPGTGTVTVDARWRIHADPEVLVSWTVERLGATLVHHAGHALRDHAGRARSRGVDDDHTGHWVAAADAEINDDLPGDVLGALEDPTTPADLEAPDGRFAEEYYEAALARDRASGHDCGSGAHGQGDDGDDDGDDDNDDTGDGPPGLTAYHRDLIRHQVARDTLEHAAAGDVPAGWRRWAEEVIGARVDWRRALAAEVRRGLARAAGRVDYTYRRPSRRAPAVPGVILPSLRQPTPRVAVVVDTSASMSDDLLSRALAEVDGILRASGVRGEAVRVLACDHAVHTSRRVTSARQVELVGGGGTSMAVGIAEAASGRPPPEVIVVLTDGETPWPAAPPRRASVVVGLLGARSRWAPEPPSWARVVTVEP